MSLTLSNSLNPRSEEYDWRVLKMCCRFIGRCEIREIVHCCRIVTLSLMGTGCILKDAVNDFA